MKTKWKKITLDKHYVSRHKGVRYFRARTNADNPKDIILLADYRPFVTGGVANEIALGGFFAFAYREVPIFRPEFTQICVIISQKPTVDFFIDSKRGNRVFVPCAESKSDYFPEHDNGELARIFIWKEQYMVTDVHGKEIIADRRSEFDCKLDPSCASAIFTDPVGMNELEASLREFTGEKYWESKS